MSVAAAPVAIGGVGGSGTRLVAALVTALGLRSGPDLNGPLDNLWYTLLFKHPAAPDLAPADFAARAQLFVAALSGERLLTDDERALVAALVDDRPQHPRAWLQGRADSLLAATRRLRPPARWFWKEPNTHILLPQWRAQLPRLRYIHVVRNGLDMAFSDNQNQRALWGERLLGRPVQDTPADALAYWCAAHRRVQAIGASLRGDFLWLDYDALCADPEPALLRLAAFLDVPAAAALALRGMAEVRESSGRGRDAGLAQFAAEDLDYLRGLGHL